MFCEAPVALLLASGLISSRGVPSFSIIFTFACMNRVFFSCSKSTLLFERWYTKCFFRSNGRSEKNISLGFSSVIL